MIWLIIGVVVFVLLIMYFITRKEVYEGKPMLCQHCKRITGHGFVDEYTVDKGHIHGHYCVECMKFDEGGE